MKNTGTRSNSTQSVSSALGGLQLVLIQGIVCIVILIVAVICKLIGGNVYESAVGRFREGMYDNHLLTAPTVSQNITTTTTATEHAVSEVSNAVAVTAAEKTVYAPLNGGIITSSFGQRTDPVTGEPLSFHHGVDIAAPKETPLHALMDGTVVDVGYEENGYGWYVVVQCASSHHYVYAHCHAVKVTVNQSIKAGETIALVGSTGKSTGDHLHFEWRENGKAVDPMTILPKETYV